jgi:gas vesicle protein
MRKFREESALNAALLPPLVSGPRPGVGFPPSRLTALTPEFASNDRSTVLPPDQRTTWTDERLDERMNSLDRTIGLMQNDVGGIRAELLEFRRQQAEEMRALREAVTSEMQQLRSDFSSELQQLRSDFSSEMQQLRSDFSSEMQQLRSDFSSELQSTRSELGSEIRLLRADVTMVQERLVQIGFGLVGVLAVFIASLVAAVS